jgi:alanine-glyoxylate transaminase / serine-glyoxylate transaminase / serine-pyruvate transaminase
MESVARQFAFGKHSMVLRNGWFSYRWTEILEMGSSQQAWGNHTTHTVLHAIPEGSTTTSNSSTSTSNSSSSDHTTATTTSTTNEQEQQPQYRPPPIEHVLEMIQRERPAVFFCPHVETSTGIILPDAYLRQIATAMHQIPHGLLVVDCIASGTVWLDMADLGIDVIISAPQKGWSGPPCAALVMMSTRAMDVLHTAAPNSESSFSLSLPRWSKIMDAYIQGGFAYHTTMPTDALRDFHEVTIEMAHIGMQVLKERQMSLGQAARQLLQERYQLRSVAAPTLYAAPGVLVYYSPGCNIIENPVMMSTFHTHAQVQIAMGVPWKLQEPVGLKTFRIGLFGLPKLMHMESTLQTLQDSFDAVLQQLQPIYHFPLLPSQQLARPIPPLPLPAAAIASPPANVDTTTTTTVSTDNTRVA